MTKHSDPRIRLFGVDAFASKVFGGNPAAVCLLQAAATVPVMQSVAAEMNLSETAFLVPEPGTRRWGLRWFTPSSEVDLCGHATLASAHVLWESDFLEPDEPAEFQTRVSGVLSCRRDGDRIAMDFPARPASATEAPSGLLNSLGCEAVWVGRTAYDFLIEVGDARVVRQLRPDYGALARLPVRGVIVTSRCDDGFDFVSRFFAPGVGVAEDPVTGSAHCSLGPYWAERLGRNSLHAWQASARGGEVGVRVKGDRVELSGQAFTTWRGEWVARMD
ncbi:MAG: PhzF family phenazine biosynthesis protein [Verrucomicrobiales bacterium]|nr:PhzF family phenazine biosynthesis protein [Verrucomicrobiales bacterium]